MNKTTKDKAEYAKLSDEERAELADLEHPDWTDKQRKFAQCFIACGSLSVAIRQAGYNVKPENAYRMAYELRHKPHVRAYLDETIKTNLARFNVSNERLVEEAAKLAFANPAQHIRINDDGTFYIDFSAMTAEDLAAIQEATVETYFEKDADGDAVPVKRTKVKMASKQAALELLMRHKKMLTDRVEITGGIDIAQRIQEGRRRLKPEKGNSNGSQVEVKALGAPVATRDVRSIPNRHVKKDGLE